MNINNPLDYGYDVRVSLKTGKMLLFEDCDYSDIGGVINVECEDGTFVTIPKGNAAYWSARRITEEERDRCPLR